MAKQQSNIQMGAYFLNGRKYNNTAESPSYYYTEFDGYPQSYPIWNINYRAEKEFITSATSKSLTGFERGNPGGFRIRIDVALRNTTNTQTSNIKSLLDLVSSQYQRFVISTDISGAPTYNATTNISEVTLATDISNYSNAYQGAYVVNIDKNDTKFRCTRFSITPQKFNLQGNVNASSWANTDNLNVVLEPDKPTIIGISTDNTTSNIIYCNLISSTLGIERELTIGNQIINLSLRSVERYQTIPSSLAI